MQGVPLTQRQLDDACEAHLQQRFGEKLDFAVENSLPFLIHDGLIRETSDVRPFLVPTACDSTKGTAAASFELLVSYIYLLPAECEV